MQNSITQRNASEQPNYSTTAEQARGAWLHILTASGINPGYLTGKHGPCPGCGGKDRFRFDDKDGRGTWFCNQGGEPIAGDGFALLQHAFSCTASEALDRVRRCLGTNAPTPLPKPPQRRIEASPTQRYALALWGRADRSDAAVASHPYARRKGIDWHAGIGRATASGAVIGQGADCLICPVRTIEDQRLVAVQCINPEGRKQTFGPIKGAAFQLGNIAAKGAWYVVEGVADAVSVFKDTPCDAVFATLGIAGLADAPGLIEAAHDPARIIVLEDAA